ncbi:MAG: aminomethyltransferase beta-barrel domain-containing protein, partial [Candidatus Limnocylindrales bacterium]
LGSPRYVSRVDPLTNTIQLGRREDLETTRIDVEDVRFIDDRDPAASFRAAVRIRHRGAPVPATIRRDDGRWVVTTDQPVWAIAPGQAAVLYDGETCLGGGRIARTAVSAAAAPGAAVVPAAAAPPAPPAAPARQAVSVG